MGALKNIQPNFSRRPENNNESVNTLPLGTVKNQDTTLATVMMTQLYDTEVQIKFNRLMLMGQNDKVSSTYPLNRKITSIGRSRRNHIVIKDPLISVKHLTISVSGNTCVVNDLESSNGTFINGERLVGGRVLRDGEEIMLGKTVLRFAARQTGTSVREAKPSKRPIAPSKKKRFGLLAAAVIFFMISTLLVYLGTHIASQLFAVKGSYTDGQTTDSPQPISDRQTQRPQAPAESEKKAAISATQVPSTEASLIQRSLTDYAAGRMDSAEQTLKMVSTAKEGTPQAIQARRLLSMIGTVKKLHAQAKHAQSEKMFAKAINSWDRLLIMDVELVGDRPSFFAAQAEQRVQELSYDQALDAYRLKNHKKAKQLCKVILQINPTNSEALALLAKIDPKA